ncbi:MAG: hypothetical protein ABIS70_10180 [Actinomycetota bacterium]
MSRSDPSPASDIARLASPLATRTVSAASGPGSKASRASSDIAANSMTSHLDKMVGKNRSSAAPTKTQVTEGFGSSRAFNNAFCDRSAMRCASLMMNTCDFASMGERAAEVTMSRMVSTG